MRKGCPVAHSNYLWWSLFRHEDVMRVLEDHETFRLPDLGGNPVGTLM